MNGYVKIRVPMKTSEETKNGLTLIGHLDELRRRVFISLTAVGIGALCAYFKADAILAILVRPLGEAAAPLVYFGPTDAFVAQIKVALFAGLLAASPVVIGQLWLFVSPALYGKERRILFPITILTSALFLTGAVFCYFFVLPPALRFLMGTEHVWMRPMLSVNEYLAFVTWMMTAFGIAFNLPLAILAAVVAGVLDASTLMRYQRHAIVLIFIAAAILTPTPDIASQLFLAAPMTFLYEVSVAGAFMIQRARKKKKEALR